MLQWETDGKTNKSGSPCDTLANLIDWIQMPITLLDSYLDFPYPPPTPSVSKIVLLSFYNDGFIALNNLQTKIKKMIRVI